MEQELDYAEMLEIPVSTVNVVKKKSLFRRKSAEKQSVQAPENQDELKEKVVESVNERVGAYVYSEDLSEHPEAGRKKKSLNFGKDKASRIIFGELIAVCVIAIAIFLTNVFMPTSAINTFIGSFSKKSAEKEPNYSDLELSAVVSELSDVDVQFADGGYLFFQAESCVYPVCDGTISSVAGEDGTYTVQIAHTSKFSSVITGLSSVYCKKGDAVRSNLPFAYSDGQSEVQISLYDGNTLLKCYSLSGVVPVWNS